MRRMKTRNIILGIALMSILPVWAQKSLKIEGTVQNPNDLRAIYLFRIGQSGKLPDIPTDTLQLKQGKFQATLDLTQPMRAFLQAKRKDGGHDATNIVLVPGEKLHLDFESEHFYVSGSKFYKQWGEADRLAMKYNQPMQRIIDRVFGMPEELQKDSVPILEAEYGKLQEARQKALTDYYAAHLKEEGCALYYTTNAGTTLTYYDKLDAGVKNGRFASLLTNDYNRQKAEQDAREKEQSASKAAQAKTAEGQMFVDFEAEYEGKVQKLSDYVGHGKYVLVDFWASWCGPCKAEIPNLIEAWNKYHGERFEVLGVATWDKPADTMKAIEQMKIPYPQIMNAQYAGSDAYGISGIPQIILFGPDGRIVKRNLRGAQIEKTLQEVLK